MKLPKQKRPNRFPLKVDVPEELYKLIVLRVAELETTLTRYVIGSLKDKLNKEGILK